jgi:hypothetical protein
MVEIQEGFVGEQTPEVRFEPCMTWESSPDPVSGSCLFCGWLEEDHWMAELERRAAGQAVGAAS